MYLLNVVYWSIHSDWIHIIENHVLLFKSLLNTWELDLQKRNNIHKRYLQIVSARLEVKLTRYQWPQWLAPGEQSQEQHTLVYQSCCTGVWMSLFLGRSQSHRFWSHLWAGTPWGYYQAEGSINKTWIKTCIEYNDIVNNEMLIGRKSHFNVQMQNVHAVNVTNSFKDLLDVWLDLK